LKKGNKKAVLKHRCPFLVVVVRRGSSCFLIRAFEALTINYEPLTIINYEPLITMNIISKNQETIKPNSSIVPSLLEELGELGKTNAGDADSFMETAPLTDTGNAECFENEFGSDYLYNITNNQWLRWNDVIWEADKNNKVDSDILSTVRRRQIVAASSETNQITDKSKILNYLVRCENVRNRKDIKQAAQWLQHFATTIEQYDTDTYLASTLNGTLNLRTGEFYKAKRSDYITRQMGAHYEPEAECPRWLKFLDEITGGDAELIKFVQKIIGYGLTGDTIEQKMFILNGFGKNGKSVFIKTIQALLGDYASSASFKTFDADKQSEQTNDLAALNGRRFVSIIETEKDKKLNEPLVKLVTGGDRVTCRFLHKEFFEYLPQFKLFLATNHRPVITQANFAIWRRIVLIPFTQNFEGREEEGLDEKLLAELSGILNWALAGLRLWQTERLKAFPKSVMEATGKYKEDSDTVGQWLDLRVRLGSILQAQSSTAYTDYRDWTIENGYFALSNRSFKSALEEKGFLSQRETKGVVWRGFELKPRF
jgi:putative DNA primase/helicase